MFRDIVRNKWVIGGFGFLIVFSIACYFWYQRELAPYKKDAAEFSELLLQWERSPNQDTKSTEETIDDTPIGSTMQTIGKSQISTTTAGTKGDEIVEIEQKNQETDNTENASVSLNGFGPYPKVPDGYPEFLMPIWIRNPTGVGIPGHAAGVFELMDRVLIKLWKQGHTNITGASTAYGKIYPHYTDVVYIKYKDIPLPDGTVFRQIIRVKGGPNLAPFIKQIQKGKIPEGIQVIEFNNAGIDPHTFLKMED